MESSDRLSAERRAPATFHQVLIIIFGTLFFTGDEASVSLEERVSDAVDGDRAATAIEIARRIDATWQEDMRSIVEWHGDYCRLLARPEATVDDLEANLDGIIETLGRYDRAQVEMRFELRDVLSEAEWGEVFPR